MKSFNVSFHQEDNVDVMQIQKLTEQEFSTSTARGTRRLFELDTNVGYFVFFDAEDEGGNISYLVLQYEGENEVPNGCYSFEMKDFYEFLALYTLGMNMLDEEDESEEEEDPIHHLAHLLYHVVEEGNAVNPD